MACYRKWPRKHDGETEKQRQERLEIKRAYYAAHKIRINALVRFKWASDPEHRKKCRIQARRYKLKGRYGISEEEYDAIITKQKGSCAICQKKPVRRLSIDHCHSTGVVRGLLCFKCNAGLGCYDDDPNRMLVAAAYLRAFCGNR